MKSACHTPEERSLYSGQSSVFYKRYYIIYASLMYVSHDTHVYSVQWEESCHQLTRHSSNLLYIVSINGMKVASSNKSIQDTRAKMGDYPWQGELLPMITRCQLE